MRDPRPLPEAPDPRREPEGGSGGLRLGGASGPPAAGTRTCIRSPRASAEPLILRASPRDAAPALAGFFKSHSVDRMKKFKRRLSLTLRGSQTIDESLSELAEQMTIEENSSKDNEPIVKNGRPPTSHSMHSFLHQYTGSFKKPPLRRPHSVIGGSLGSFMAMPRNGSRLDIVHENLKMGSDGESDQASGTSSDEVQSPTGVCLRNRIHRRISMEVTKCLRMCVWIHVYIKL